MSKIIIYIGTELEILFSTVAKIATIQYIIKKSTTQEISAVQRERYRLSYE